MCLYTVYVGPENDWQPAYPDLTIHWLGLPLREDPSKFTYHIPIPIPIPIAVFHKVKLCLQLANTVALSILPKPYGPTTLPATIHRASDMTYTHQQQSQA